MTLTNSYVQAKAIPLNLIKQVCKLSVQMASMDVGFQFLRRFQTMEECKTDFDHGKPSGVVVEVHTVSQWTTYINASRENNKLLVIDFTAEWCGPCRQMDPILQDFAAKYTDVDFIKIDVDEMKTVAQQFNPASMPAYALVKKGKEVDMVTGVRVVELQDKIEKHRM